MDKFFLFATMIMGVLTASCIVATVFVEFALLAFDKIQSLFNDKE